MFYRALAQIKPATCSEHQQVSLFNLNIATPYLLTVLVLIFGRHFYYLSKVAGWLANSVDSAQTPRSDLGLHCLLRPVKWGKYSNQCKINI